MPPPKHHSWCRSHVVHSVACLDSEKAENNLQLGFTWDKMGTSTRISSFAKYSTWKNGCLNVFIQEQFGQATSETEVLFIPKVADLIIRLTTLYNGLATLPRRHQVALVAFVGS